MSDHHHHDYVGDYLFAKMLDAGLKASQSAAKLEREYGYKPTKKKYTIPQAAAIGIPAGLAFGALLYVLGVI